MDGAISATEPQYAIPATLNSLLCIGVWISLLACLLITAYASYWPVQLLAIVAFSFIGNTCFALLHESVHGVLHPNRAVNRWLGRINAALFPTSYTFQRATHLGHHARNRTDVEMFDLYYPTDNLFLKRMQIYAILTGAPYWAAVVLGCVIFTFVPGLFNLKILRSKESQVIQHAGGDAMISGLDKVPAAHVRLETLMFLIIQAGILAAMSWNWAAWLLCYLAFAVNWSSLQYTDHAFSARDVRNGAWNLKVNPITRAFFLNYHDHLAHHQYPWVPWIHLPKFVDDCDDGPSWLSNYLRLWRGPELTREPPPGPITPEFYRKINASPEEAGSTSE